MARVTIEDCIKVVPSRFELVVLGAQRTHEIASYGQDATTEKRHNKEVVTALREIATGFVSPDALRESIIKKSIRTRNLYQKLMSLTKQKMASVMK